MAGLCPDPLEEQELMRSPDSLAAIRAPTCKGRNGRGMKGRKRGKGGKWI